MAMDVPASAPGTGPVWQWRYGDAEGRPVTATVVAAAMASPRFQAQADAESWVGEFWGQLLRAGVDSVTLEVDGADIYGPMSLHPVAG